MAKICKNNIFRLFIGGLLRIGKEGELKAKLNECSDDALVYCFNTDNESIQIADDFEFVSKRTDAFGVIILTRDF